MQGAANREGLPCVMHAEDAVQTVTTTCAGCLLNARASPLLHVPAAIMCRRPLTCLSACRYLPESLHA